MKKLRRILLWYWLLNKRLFKKISFIIILALVPLTVAAFGAAAGEDSGILTIALSQEDPADKTASEAVESLMSDDGVILYEIYGTPQEAIDTVKNGKADAAWVFAENMQAKMEDFVSDSPAYEPVVRIYAIEESTFLSLAREKLFASLYSGMSHALYKDFILTEISPEADEEAMEYHYGVTAVDRDIIQFAFMDEDISEENANRDYLTAPVRGMLALLVVLVGLAASMYLMHDEEAGTYTWLSMGAKIPFAWGWHLIAVTDVAAVVCIALWGAGLFTTWQREIPLMLLYCLSCVVFCDTVRRLCGKMERLGVAIPIIMLLMIVLCPLFLNIRRLRVIQYLLPTFYYLHAVNNGDFVFMLAVYTVAMFAVNTVIGKIQSR